MEDVQKDEENLRRNNGKKLFARSDSSNEKEWMPSQKNLIVLYKACEPTHNVNKGAILDVFKSQAWLSKACKECQRRLVTVFYRLFVWLG